MVQAISYEFGHKFMIWWWLIFESRCNNRLCRAKSIACSGDQAIDISYHSFSDNNNCSTKSISKSSTRSTKLLSSSPPHPLITAGQSKTAQREGQLRTNTCMSTYRCGYAARRAWRTGWLATPSTALGRTASMTCLSRSSVPWIMDTRAGSCTGISSHPTFSSRRVRWRWVTLVWWQRNVVPRW